MTDSEDIRYALAEDLRRMALMGPEPKATVSENPVFIQSLADGVTYQYAFPESSSGKYVYADVDGNTRILSGDDIAKMYRDVTEVETRLRSELHIKY